MPAAGNALHSFFVGALFGKKNIQIHFSFLFGLPVKIIPYSENPSNSL